MAGFVLFSSSSSRVFEGVELLDLVELSSSKDEELRSCCSISSTSGRVGVLLFRFGCSKGFANGL